MRYPILKWTILVLTPLLVCPLLMLDIAPAPAARCAAVVLLMAVYWLVTWQTIRGFCQAVY